MDLLYCGNRGVFGGIVMSTLSVVKRLQQPRPLEIHIFTMDLTRKKQDYTPITQEQAAGLEQHLRVHNPDTTVKLYDVTALYEFHLAGSPNEDCYCSPYTLLRLLADLAELPGKLLYLDADVLLCRDISALYDVDISDYEYAAAPDHYGKILVHPGYINAGVLLINLSRCRQTGLLEKARRLIREKKLPFADQSALIRSTTRRLRLPQRFNEQVRLRHDSVIRHFSQRLFLLPYPHIANIKPWQTGAFYRQYGSTCFDDILAEYTALKEASHWIP